MVRSVRAYWRNRQSYQTFLYAVGTLLILSGLFHLVVFLVRGGSWSGPVSWRKPVVFGVSFGLTTTTIGWVLGFLRPWRIVGWILATPFAAATAAEVFLVGCNGGGECLPTSTSQRPSMSPCFSGWGTR